jgi:ABC-type lipoprotein export system ATPase subunit
MGVVVVGPSGSGKSTLWKIMRQALAKVGKVVRQYVMNPKAMPRTQVRCPGFHFLLLLSFLCLAAGPH